MAGRFAPAFLVTRFQAEIERLLQEALALGEGTLPASGEWQPPVDIVETPEAILILAEVPGVAAADLTVEVKGLLVTLSGTKSTPLPEARRLHFQCVERGHGRFCREVQLFWPVNTHQGTARLTDGLLSIEFPRIQEKRQGAHRLQVVDGDGDASRPGEGRRGRKTRAR